MCAAGCRIRFGGPDGMNITCPNCNTSYAVDAMTFPADGRSVRCARCRTVWHAMARRPQPTILLPNDDPAGAALVQDDPAHGDFDASAVVAVPARPGPSAEALGARIVDDGSDGVAGSGAAEPDQAAGARARLAAVKAGRRPTIRRKNGGYRGLEAFVLGAIVAIVFAAVHYREDVVRSVPASAGLFELAGLPVNLRGLEFDRVAQRRDFEDGVPVLIVEGEIVNIRDRPTAVPALRFSLRGKAGDEIYAWTLEPRQRVVEQNQAMSFRTRLASPPRGAEDVRIRFIERDRRVAERPQ